MLKKAGHQYVVDEVRGISLEATGPYDFKYQQKDHSVTISSEPLKSEDDDTYSVCLYITDLEEWDEPESVPITEKDKDKIADFAKEAIELLGFEVEVE